MIYVLKKEPSPGAFADILDHGLTQCAFALLVVQPLKRISPQAAGILQKLEPYLVEKKVTPQWPGTKLSGGTGLVHRYKLEQPFVDEIAKMNDHLYSWLQPDFPEDICLLRENGEPWFVSIAHEKDGYFSLPDDDRSGLIQKIPELGGILTRDKGNHIN